MYHADPIEDAYYHEREMAEWAAIAAEEAAIKRHLFLQDSKLISDELWEECSGEAPYKGAYASPEIWDADRLERGDATGINSARLLSLAFGLTDSPKARLAAVDELARRIGIPQVEPSE